MRVHQGPKVNFRQRASPELDNIAALECLIAMSLQFNLQDTVTTTMIVTVRTGQVLAAFKVARYCTIVAIV
jgi:hypothetical protein